MYYKSIILNSELFLSLITGGDTEINSYINIMDQVLGTIVMVSMFIKFLQDKINKHYIRVQHVTNTEAKFNLNALK